MTQGIEGKVVVITGGSSGLGEATARYLAEKGAIVAIAARRRDRLDRIVADVASAGGRAKGYQVDVAQRAQLDALVTNVMKDFGRIDVLVNNAGVMPIAPLSQRRVDEWDRMIDVNVKGLLCPFLKCNTRATLSISARLRASRFSVREVPFIRPRSLPFALSLKACAMKWAAVSA